MTVEYKLQPDYRPRIFSDNGAPSMRLSPVRSDRTGDSRSRSSPSQGENGDQDRKLLVPLSNNLIRR